MITSHPNLFCIFFSEKNRSVPCYDTFDTAVQGCRSCMQWSDHSCSLPTDESCGELSRPEQFFLQLCIVHTVLQRERSMLLCISPTWNLYKRFCQCFSLSIPSLLVGEPQLIRSRLGQGAKLKDDCGQTKRTVNLFIALMFYPLT